MQSRLIPFTIAGTICFAAAFILGASFWYFFGTKPRSQGGNNTTVQTSNQNSIETNSNAANFNPTPNVASTAAPEVKKAPAGEIKISSGESTVGGEVMLSKDEGTLKMPLRRVSVADFAIGETEVTNAQYAEFVEAAKHKSPLDWKDGKFLPGTGDEPVTNITWADANDYCAWLSKELGATVRLPSEAEWERAARGDTDNKYPWGNKWNDEAAQSVETNGKIRSVKSLSAGRSPFGVYEMVGNVWEWTSDLVVDEFGKPVLHENSKRRIMKGGSAKENRKDLTIDVSAARPEDNASAWLGFRYVIIRK
ncbi:MAG: formylglycine-generating enzyme family protein [Pyrinomonadaceae bacterium]